MLNLKLKWWHGLVFNMVLASLAIGGSWYYVRYVKYSRVDTLEIRNADNRRLYAKWTLENNEEFAIEFIHSVHQSPVRDTFIAEDKKIKPVRASFSSFGAGIQSDLDAGQSLTREGNMLVISGFQYSFDELNYIVGTVFDHLLYIKGETVSLSELCGRNAHITLRIK